MPKQSSRSFAIPGWCSKSEVGHAVDCLVEISVGISFVVDHGPDGRQFGIVEGPTLVNGCAAVIVFIGGVSGLPGLDNLGASGRGRIQYVAEVVPRPTKPDMNSRASQGFLEAGRITTRSYVPPGKPIGTIGNCVRDGQQGTHRHPFHKPHVPVQ